MTHVRRPNRRPIPGLAELVNGGACAASGKVRYLDRRAAETARVMTARADPDQARAARLHVYQHAACGDWHIGHDQERPDG